MNGVIRVFQGDLTEQAVDAIVNAANTDLLLGAGVAGAIRKKGGPSIQEECNRHGPIGLGEAALTGAGALKARFVLHAAGIRLGGAASAVSILGSTEHCLRLAHEKGLRSVAFPAIGTGVAGFPMEECARVMLGAAKKHLAGSTSVREIAFVLFDAAGAATFRSAAKDLDIAVQDEA